MRAIAIVLATLGAGANAQVREIPGVMEFSGRLVARPLSESAWRARGLTAPAAAAQRRLALDALAAYRPHRQEPLVDHHVFELPPGATEADAIARLVATGLFEFVEPDWRVYPLDCPNDPELAAQWHHGPARLDSCAAWQIHPGIANVSVGICDTGIQVGHPDLRLNRLEGYNAVDMLWESQGGAITPIHPHGTQVTGCAAANGGNGVGVSGVGLNLGHRMLRVTNDAGGATNLSILTHAALTSIQAGDRVACVSYSGVDSAAVRSTATQIKSMGGLLVWSAGNDGALLAWGDRDDDDLICVGATASDDGATWFSGYGPSLDLVAPGVNVYTTTTGGAYASATGTSFSAPLVAGLIALLWSYNPDLTPDAVERALKLGCDDLGPSGPDDTFGHGRIDVRAALLRADPPPIRFSFPGGRPETLDPMGGATIEVLITTHGTTLEGVPELHYDDGDGEENVDLVPAGGDLYLAIFPVLPCGQTVRYHISAGAAGGRTWRSPYDAPDAAYEALAIRGVFEHAADAFEAESGWTVGDAGDTATSGLWTRMDPTATAAQPGDDVTPDGAECWVTDGRGGGLGAYDVDGGATTLTSPPIGLAGIEDPVVSYWRWYSNDKGADPANDTFRIAIDGGAGWVDVETVGPSGPEAVGGWRYHQFRVRDFVDPADAVRLRFVAEDAGPGSVVEAAIDELRISEFDCGGRCIADFNDSGFVNTLDFIAFFNAWSRGDPAADINADGAVNSLDSIVFLNAWNAGC